MLILLALFVYRPGASRLKSRIITSISAAVGRPVDIGTVHIQLLPRPGFDIGNLVVYDDAEFGAEPILRAGEVTASLRLMSLLRGRLEISRLDLTEPSLNLVHSSSGRWNIEGLLERSSRIPLAPTGKSKREPRPGFPYIEITSGRINFKSGAEKRAYALTNADFSLWQDSENTWGVRLKAQPVRTDLNLSDMGSLRITGTWQRAQTFRDTPLQFSIEWSRAQLGQFTKLLTGYDKGWRGTIQLDLDMSGSPGDLKVSSGASIDDFRRYDITSGKPLRIGAHCDGKYSAVTHDFRELLCSAPVGNGLITLTGDMGLPGTHQFALMLRAANVPASAVVVLAARSKKNLPEDLEADGTLHGDISVQENAAAGESLQLKGGGDFAELRLTSSSNKIDLALESLPFKLTDGTSNRRERERGIRQKGAALKMPDGPRLEIGPVEVATRRATSAILQGWINRAGYKLALGGEIEIARAIRLGRVIGLPVWASEPEGSAQLDLLLTGVWSGLSGAGFVGPQLTGMIRPRNLKVVPRGFGGPVEIASAEIQLSPEQVRVSKLVGKAGGASWTGSLEMPRGCGVTCPITVALRTNQLVLGELGDWLGATSKKRAWYRVLESTTQSAPALLTTLHVSGRASADQLLVHGVAAKHVSAKITLQDGQLHFSDISADVLDGRAQGEWTADFTRKQALCKGHGKLSEVSLDGFAKAMDDGWIAGTATASYESAGKCFADFWKSAEGALHVDMQDGAFPHVTIGEDAEPLRFIRLNGQANVHAGQIEIKDAKLDSPDGKFSLSGTASFKREIDFRLTPATNEATAFEITGTLAAPHVAPISAPVQARLKPLAHK